MLLEEFSYDLHNRLDLYTCSGEQLPTDRYGNETIMQVFVFDALGNVSVCRTFFKDGTKDTADFTYDAADPCQLKSVSHTHPSMPTSHSFSYDSNGNMLNDELGQRLRYDSQGRLLSVSDPQARTVTDYRYDSHNHLFGVTQSGQAETLRFYQNDRLSNTIQGNKHIQYLYNQSQPLGQQEAGDAGQTLLLMANAKHSVIGEQQGTNLRTEVYNAYGERSSSLQSPLGYNGEICEPDDRYMLGRGYRTYNPYLMRFHNPDSQSPFGDGGANPYQYALCDPVNFSDPTGRSVFWDILGIAFSGLSIMSGNPALVALGVGGLMSGQAALAATILGDEKTANDARTAGFIFGIGEMGVSMLGRGAVAQHHFTTNINYPRRFSAPAVMGTSSRRNSASAVMGTSSRRNSAPALMDASTGMTPRHSVSTGTNTNVLVEAATLPSLTRSYVSELAVAEFKVLEAPIIPTAIPIENFTRSAQTVKLTTNIEAAKNLRSLVQNKYKRPTSSNHAVSSMGVFVPGTLRKR